MKRTKKLTNDEMIIILCCIGVYAYLVSKL